MKRCPECRRDYYDDSLLYCLDDGTALLEGPAMPGPSVSAGGRFGDDQQTAILSEPSALAGGMTSSESATRAQFHAAEPDAQPRDNFRDPAQRHSHSANRAAKPGVSAKATNRAAKPKARAGLLLASALVVIVLAIGGYLGYRSFYASGQQINSIAVMPFVNENGDPETEYLSDGMMETLINGLSQVPRLSVKARSSVFRYKGKEYDPRTIAKELGVEALLSGRLTQRGDTLALSVELVDGRTENVLWGGRYERKSADLVQLQKDLAHDVSGALKSRLSGAEEAKVTRSYTKDPKAFEFYLKGRYFGRQFTLDGFNRGVDAFNQAIAIDPNYALAYSGLSDAYFNASTVHLPPREALPKVGEFAQKALALDDSLAAAHHSIANYKANYQRDNDGAKREFERSLQLDPNDSSIYFDYCQLLANIGESERSIAVAKSGKLVDAQDAYMSYALAQAYVLAGRYDEAIEETQTTERLDDKNWWGFYWRGVAYSEKGMKDEAVAALQIAAGLDDSPLIRGVLASVLARAGRRAEAQQVVDDLIAASQTKFVSQTSIAMGYVGLGDMDKAFEWLGRALDSHDEQMLWIYKHPMFARLRMDPRYPALLESFYQHTQ